jgi:hypothetical protein
LTGQAAIDALRQAAYNISDKIRQKDQLDSLSEFTKQLWNDIFKARWNKLAEVEQMLVMGEDSDGSKVKNAMEELKSVLDDDVIR